MIHTKHYIDCLRPIKTDKEGTLYLRAKGNGNHSKKSLKIKVDYSQFFKHFDKAKQRFSSKMLNYKILNQEIEKAFRIDNIKPKPTAKKEKKEDSFIKYWQSILVLETNYGTKSKHEVIINKINRYLDSIGKKDLLFTDITPTFLRELQGHFLTVKDPKKMSPNGVTHYLKVIKSIITKRIKEVPSLYAVNPFITIKMDTNPDAVKRVVLTDSDISKILNGSIDDKQLDFVRKYFCLQIWSAGCRVSDLMLMRWNNFSYGPNSTFCKYKYKMFKTGKEMSMPMNIHQCKVIRAILGQSWAIDEIYNETRFFKDYFSENSGVGYEYTPQQMEQVLANHCLQIELESKEVTSFINYERDSKENISYYKGYAFSTETKNIMVEIIDYIEAVKLDLERFFIHQTGQAIRRHIEANNCANHFVLPYLDNGLFSNIGSDNNFDAMPEEQYKKLRMAEILYNKHLIRVGKALDVPHFSSHAARHTFTKLMVDNNTSSVSISQVLGHTNIRTTDHYLRHNVFNENKNDALINTIANKHK